MHTLPVKFYSLIQNNIHGNIGNKYRAKFGDVRTKFNLDRFIQVTICDNLINWTGQLG